MRHSNIPTRVKLQRLKSDFHSGYKAFWKYFRFLVLYKVELRAGVEGVFSQGIRLCGLRQARYVGLAETHLQQVFTAMAINIIRVGNWFAGVPLAQTRRSVFVRLHEATLAA